MHEQDVNFESLGLLPTDDEVDHNFAHRERFETEEVGQDFESVSPSEHADVPADVIYDWISDPAHDLVLFYEVGGLDGYLRKYRHPTWPQAASGITIGFGYDLGYHSPEQVQAAWAPHLTERDFGALARVVGLTGEAAQQALSAVQGIDVPWEAAAAVYQQQTVPTYARRVLSIYPGAEKIHPDCFGALFSLVYNRGPKLTGDTRREMLRIRELIRAGKFDLIPDEIRSMKRIWEGRNLGGLLKRREAEASLFEAGLADLEAEEHNEVEALKGTLESVASQDGMTDENGMSADSINAIIQSVQNKDWQGARTATASAIRSDALSDAQARNFLRLVDELQKQNAFEDLSQRKYQAEIDKLILDIRDAAGKNPNGDKQISPATAAAKAFELYELLKKNAWPLPADKAIEVLGYLKSTRAFDGLARVGDRLIVNGHREPSVRKLTAQGLIDSGQLSAALDTLQQLVSTTDKTHQEHVDALGLIGRVHKQIYVDASMESDVTPAEQGKDFAVAALREAIKSYAQGFDVERAGPTSYHGINLVALLMLADRDRVVPPINDSAQDIARAIIADLEGSSGDKQVDQWHAATLGEAYAALGDWEAAARWYGEYAEQADAFALAGSIRQLEEVWGVGAGPTPAGQIVAALKTRLLRLERGHIELTVDERRALQATNADDVAGAVYERVIKDDKRVAAEWFLEGANRCRSIARVNTKLGEAVGTGFLVRGGDFVPEYGDRLLFLTNNHVISTISHHGVQPNQVKILFDGVGDSRARTNFVCKKLLWQSAPQELDATLIELHPTPDHLPFCPISFDPPVPLTSQVVIIGHPAGKNLTVSLYDSRLLDHGTKDGGKPHFKYLHYQTATEPGSSGSPVFDHRSWQIVGLHHAGPSQKTGTLPKLNGKHGAHEANEGVDIHSIRNRIVKEMVQSSEPQPSSGAKPGLWYERAATPPPGPAEAPEHRSRPATGTLVENLPRRMAVGVPQLVEVRISGVHSAQLLEELAGGGDVLTHDVAIASAMNVELSSPSGGISITPIKSKPQIINRMELTDQDVTEASWQWRLEPLKSGEHELLLIVSAQEIVESGLIAEQTQVSQSIPITVQINLERLAWRATRWGTVAAAAGVIGYYAQRIVASL